MSCVFCSFLNMESKLNKCSESPASLSFLPLPPSPPPNYSKRRSNSTPSSLNLTLLPTTAKQILENKDNIENYFFDADDKSSHFSTSPPTSPSKVNQFVESLANSFKSPFDSLKKKTKLKLKLRSNSLFQNSYLTTPVPTFSEAESKFFVTENVASSSPKSPESNSSTSNPLTAAILNLIKPFRKVSTSESTNESGDLSISPPLSPLSFVSITDDLVIAPPCEFASDHTFLKSYNQKELYLHWINSHVLKRPNVKASYTNESRIFYIK